MNNEKKSFGSCVCLCFSLPGGLPDNTTICRCRSSPRYHADLQFADTDTDRHRHSSFHLYRLALYQPGENQQNNVLVEKNDYKSQTDKKGFVYTYKIPAVPNDIFEVTANCNIQGEKTATLKVVKDEK